MSHKSRANNYLLRLAKRYDREAAALERQTAGAKPSGAPIKPTT